MREAAYERVDRAMQHLDMILKDKGFVAGGKRSIADPYAFAMTRWTENLPKTWKDYASVRTFMNGMYDDPDVKKIMGVQGLI